MKRIVSCGPGPLLPIDMGSSHPFSLWSWWRAVITEMNIEKSASWTSEHTVGTRVFPGAWKVIVSCCDEPLGKILPASSNLVQQQKQVVLSVLPSPFMWWGGCRHFVQCGYSSMWTRTGGGVCACVYGCVCYLKPATGLSCSADWTKSINKTPINMFTLQHSPRNVSCLAVRHMYTH